MTAQTAGLLLTAVLWAGSAQAEDHTVTVDTTADAGTLPTWFEPSAFIYWAPQAMTEELIADSVQTHGVLGLATQLELGGATSVADYVARLDASSLPTSVQTAANAGMQVIIQIQATPKWMSSSQVDARPANCQDEWPTFQTVAPAADKWDDWEAVVYETAKYFNVTKGFTNVWYQLWEEPDGPCYWTDTQANYLELWKHTVAGARLADPDARLGGPGVAGGVNPSNPVSRCRW